MKSSKNKTKIDDIQPFINILKDAQKQFDKIGIYLDFSIYTNGLYEYQDYEKYKKLHKRTITRSNAKEKRNNINSQWESLLL